MQLNSKDWQRPYLRLGFLYCLILLLITGLLISNQGFRRLESSLGLNSLFKLRGPISPPDDFVMITMNHKSAEELNLPMPTDRWSRNIHADLIDRLATAGAKLIVVDIAFRGARDELEDQNLSRSIAKAGNVVLFNYLQRYQELVGETLVDFEKEIPPYEPFLENAIASAPFVLSKFPLQVQSAQIYLDTPGGITASQPFTAYLVLHVNEAKALNDLIRQKLPDVYSLYKLNHVDFQTADWTRVFAQVFFNIIREDPKTANKINQLIKSKSKVATGQRLDAFWKNIRIINALVINFYGPIHTLKHIDYSEALLKEMDWLTSQVKDRVVYLGFSETRQTEQIDMYSTVYTNRHGVDLSGVEISATVLANLLNREQVQSLSGLSFIFAHLIIVGIVFIAMILLPVWLGVVAQLSIFIVYLVFGFYLFSVFNVWVPWVLPFLLMLLATFTAVAFRYQISRAEQISITSALNQYIPLDAAKELSMDLSHMDIQQKVVKGVCLMTDIQGYTSLSEQIPPKELHTRLNRYYERLMSFIKEENGVVANIVGDSLLAFWIAKTSEEEAAAQAMRTALKIADIMNKPSQEDINLPTSVAIHGGEFSLGNLGGLDHFEFSPVGDIVNTVSRIEPLNRKLGTKILVSSNVAEKIIAANLRYVGKFALKNKSSDTLVYELKSTPIDPQIKEAFSQALYHFEEQDYPKAELCFNRLLEELPEDGPCRYYLTECNQAKQ